MLNKSQEAKDLIGEISGPAAKRDPLNRMFFGPNVHDKEIEKFLDNDPHLKNTDGAITKTQKRALRKRKKRLQESETKQEIQAPQEKVRSSKPRAGRFKRSEDLS